MNTHIMIRAVATGLVTAGLLAFPALARDDVKSETRVVEPFSKIELKGAADIVLEAGKKQSLTMTGSEKKLAGLVTRVEDDTLVITQKGRVWGSGSLDITINVETLSSFVVEGATDATLKNIKATDFELMIAGAGDVDISGTCETANVDIAGAGDINARKFICKNVVVDINGAGDADVYASENVKATINGVGDITVFGNPKTTRPRINGFGSIDVVEKK